MIPNGEKNKIIKWENDTVGRLKCEIDLDGLFSGNEKRYGKFKKDWPKFLASDSLNDELYQLDGSVLKYISEDLIPQKKDDRPPLLLLLGNPASHSVSAGMFFSFEADKSEHRFWKEILKPSGIIDLRGDDNQDISYKNEMRKRRIMNLDYISKFRIGLSVYISMPSCASCEWSGVAGIVRLLGRKAFSKLAENERYRILKSVEKFMPEGGTIVAFQKEAWNYLKSQSDPDYRLEDVKIKGLVGLVDKNKKINLLCVPPTRLQRPCCKILKKINDIFKS